MNKSTTTIVIVIAIIAACGCLLCLGGGGAYIATNPGAVQIDQLDSYQFTSTPFVVLDLQESVAQPTPTTAPSSTPVPIDAPVPTDTPPPTATPVPTSTSTTVPPPQPQQFAGRGTRSSEIFNLSAGLVRFDISHDGTSNFAVWLLDDNGKNIDLLINEIGTLTASVGVPIAVDGRYLLNIEADGNWSISASYPNYSTASAVSNISGHGRQLTQAFLLKSGLATFQMNHNGDSNFAIMLYQANGKRVKLLVNEIGPLDDSTSVGIESPGPYFMDVEANGDWTVQIAQ